jgi:hypothetical protein
LSYAQELVLQQLFCHAQNGLHQEFSAKGEADKLEKLGKTTQLTSYGYKLSIGGENL